MDDLSISVDGDSALNLREEIAALLALLGSSRVEPVAYDTAWVARLGEIAPDLSAQAIDWLRANQLPDGSWGAARPLYYHDRVISTLAAMVALRRNGAPEDESRIRAALPTLNRSLANLHQDMAGRTIAFEMLLPSLVAEAKTLGLTVEDSAGVVCKLSQLRDAKLARAPRGLIDRYTTLGFSAEMVGIDGLHLLDIDNLQQKDGSVSVSPAATAFFAAYARPDPSALQYLHKFARQGGTPAVTAIDIFERAWALWNFTRGLHIDPEIVAFSNTLLDELMMTWHNERGIAYADIYSVQDGDNTGLVFSLMAQFGRAPDLAALWHYENTEHFRSFDLENHASVSTNIHILGGLRQAGLAVTHSAVQKIEAFLRREQVAAQFWADKWHTSPYYATGHAIVVGTGYLDDLIKDAVDWLIKTQKPDGSWGYYLSTAEETAYALQALMVRYQHGFTVPREVLDRGTAWLVRHAAPPYPPLWIIKTLYCPTLIVQSAVLGVLRQYECEFGALP